MSNLVKAIISFIILILLAILISFVLFYSKIDLGFIKFFNTHLEQKYQKEIDKTAQKIETYLKEIDADLNSFISKFDFSKFIDKLRSKNFNLVNEDNLSKELIVKHNIYCIKFFDNNKNILFSSLENERIINRGFISFVSSDRIENFKNIYSSETNNKENLLFFNGFVIFKKKVVYNNKIIGVMLFYFKESFILDILLQNEFLKYESIDFINDSLIFINKPKEIPNEELQKITIDEKDTKIIATNIKDSSGHNISKIYKNFKYTFKKFNITFLRLVDNNVFIIDKRRSTLLVFLFFLTLYILILLILSFKKSDFDKAKEKVSLFSTMLLEEIINSRTKEEIEKLKSQLGSRKKRILDSIYTDFKKLNKSNKKSLEEQLDIILKKIEESMNRNLESLQQTETIQKMEELFEKLISTITEKGIAFNYNSNIKSVNQIKKVEYKSDKVSDKVEEVEELEEIGEAEEVEELEEVSEAESVEEVEELSEDEEVEELEEVTETEEVKEPKELTSNTKEIKTLEELSEAEEVEELEEVTEKDEIEEAKEEANKIKKEEPTDIEELEEIEEVKETDLGGEEKEENVNVELIEKEDIEEESDKTSLPIFIEDAEEFNMDVFFGENNLILKRPPIFDNSSESEDVVIYEISGDQEEENKLNMDYYNESELDFDIDYFPKIMGNGEDIKLNLEEEKEEMVLKEKDQIEKSKEEDIDNIEDLFNLKREDLKDEVGNLEEDIEEIEKIDEEIPRIPDSFYDNINRPDDNLAKEIEDIEKQKTPFQILLDNICDKIGALKLSLFINSMNSGSFIQSYQFGFKESRVEQYNIEANNTLIQHIFTNKRLVYVADINKIKSIFHNNEKIYEDYKDMKSLLIYPVKIFGKIRSLIFFGFATDKREKLEFVVDILENNKSEIIKNILRLI